MNTHDVLKYGHLWVHKHLSDLTEEQMLVPGVCGVWSVKDIMSHLTSFEYVLVEVFQQCLEGGETPTLDELVSRDGDSFNELHVDRRKDRSAKEVIAEYDQQYKAGIALLGRMSERDLREPGTLPWYGNEYSIEDLIVYQYYGHKREHCAQIAIYRDALE